ncbi:MAG: hypothetical protein ABJA78_16870 [Ferruginibacter sp.]
MQIIKSLLKLSLFICPAFATAQSTYLNQGTKETHIVDRMEIKQQTNTDLNFSTLRPFNRKAIVRQAEFLDSARMGYADSTGQDKYKAWTDLDMSRVDEYNLHSLLMNNSEWVTGPMTGFTSKHTFLKSFYTTKANFYEVNNNDVFLAINPVLQLNYSKQNDNSSTLFLNSRGVSIRGMIAKKVGFSALITDNQERGPNFFGSRVNKFDAVPGVGFYKPFKKTGFDYFDGRGYFTFNAAKFIDFQIGYDKNFIGNGYRSLFLSDWGNSYLFAKINTRVWKFNYQNIFMELMPEFKKAGDTLLERKYAAMHHLSMNVSKWLNIGLFEGVIMSRRKNFDIQYLNPIIFYRHIEGSLGSKDNAVAGFDLKANVAHRVQLYGQLLLDEFVLSEIRKNDGFWGNKWAVQLGLKYMDAFGIRNLDLQLESNRVRPFTYSHGDSTANYTHYNQPLAHPLGANFQEFIGIANYQPSPRWYIYTRAIYFNQGLDSLNGADMGSDPLRSNADRRMQTGYSLASGRKLHCINTLFQLSYELKQNLYIDASYLYRNYKFVDETGIDKTSMFTIGIRLNAAKRDYDY